MSESDKGVAMLWVLFVILMVLWLVALLTAYTFGGFIHLLLVIALTILLVQVMNKHRIV